MPLSPLPTAPTPSDPPAVFNTRGFELVAALAQFVTDANALQADVNAKAADVTTKHGQVTTMQADVTANSADVTTKHGQVTTMHTDVTARQADVVTRQADVTARQADVVTRQADVTAKLTAAATSAANAAISENNALIYATQQLNSVSTTSLVTGTGQKTATVEPNKAFAQGQYLVWTSAGDPGNRMGGIVDSYNKATGSITQTFDLAVGSATRSDWVVAVGASGAVVSLTSLNRDAFQREVNNSTLVVNKRYGIWTGGGAITMTLPTLADCANGDEIVLGNLHMTWGATAFTINCPANVIFKTPTGTNDSQLVCDTNAVQGITLYCVGKDGTQATWAIL